MACRGSLDFAVSSEVWDRVGFLFTEESEGVHENCTNASVPENVSPEAAGKRPSSPGRTSGTDCAPEDWSNIAKDIMTDTQKTPVAVTHPTAKRKSKSCAVSENLEPVENRLWKAGKLYQERKEIKHREQQAREGIEVRHLFQTAQSRKINRKEPLSFLQRLERWKLQKDERMRRRKTHLDDNENRRSPHRPRLEARREAEARIANSTALWVSWRRNLPDEDTARVQREEAEAGNFTFQPRAIRSTETEFPFHVRVEESVESWHGREKWAQEYIEKHMVEETFQPKVSPMSQAMTPRGKAVFEYLHTNIPRRMQSPYVAPTKQAVLVTHATFDALEDIVHNFAQ